jgi:hypothetical protein
MNFMPERSLRSSQESNKQKEAVYISETSELFYQAIRHHIPEYVSVL